MNDQNLVKIAEQIRKKAKAVDDTVALNLDTQLLEQQLLDSMELLQLVIALEKEFAISIPLEELTAENFATIGSIGNLIEQVGGSA